MAGLTAGSASPVEARQGLGEQRARLLGGPTRGCLGPVNAHTSVPCPPHDGQVRLAAELGQRASTPQRVSVVS